MLYEVKTMLGFKKKIQIDTDVYEYLVDHRVRLIHYPNKQIYVLRVDGKKRCFPLWKLVRRFLKPGYKAEFIDKDPLNLQRHNILIKRRDDEHNRQRDFETNTKRTEGVI